VILASSTILWDVTRSSAFIAFALYTVSVVWGISITARSFRPPVAPQFDYHRFVAMLGFLAVCTHVASLLADRYAHVHLGTLVLQGTKGGQWQVMLGVIATWLLIALPLTFHLKARKLLTQRFWRLFHYVGYLVWALALVHGIAVGTDTGSQWALGLYGGAASLVAAVAWWRFVEAPPRRQHSRRAARGRAAQS